MSDCILEHESALERIRRMVDDLTEPIWHREPVDSMAVAVRRHAGHPSPMIHKAVFPCLIDQLRIACSWDTTGDDASSGVRGPISGSAPGNENALDVLLRIERECGKWNGGEGRAELKDRVRGLVGLATVLGDADLTDLRRDVACWRTWARVETGWDRRTFTADEQCPCCEHKTLRVRGDGTAARCPCGAAWSEELNELPSVFELGASIEARRHAANEHEGAA